MRAVATIDGLHAERSDGDDGDDREQEGKNQPLMLAKDQQVVVEVRLARREIPDRKAGGRRNEFNGAVGAILPRYEFVFFSHIV